jgi:hypothetical protein
VREKTSFNYVGMIATKTLSDNYSLKLICRGGKPWDTWKVDDSMECCICLGEYHEHISVQIHLSKRSCSATANWSELVVFATQSFELSKFENC